MTTINTFKVEPTSVGFSSGKLLTFRLANESYGIDILLVREIIRMQKIAPVPEVPSHVKGVINLRGKLTPVIDLRVKLGLQPENSPEDACVIVVDVEDKEGLSNLFGLIVDAVDEVISVDESTLEISSSSLTAANCEYCLGTMRSGSNVLTLLDIGNVVARELSSGIDSYPA